MEIIRISDVEPGENIVEAIRKFGTYVDLPFACLAEDVFVLLPEDCERTEAALVGAAYEAMETALYGPYDFTSYDMEDGSFLVIINGPIAAVSPASDDAADRSVAAQFMLRSRCLEACESGEILAVVLRDEGDYE